MEQSAEESSAGASAGSSALNCPRCGYDQRGQAATWREACPLEGRCSECGLTYEWADLYSPVRNVPPWCIEHVPTKAIVRGCAGTLMRSFVPWRFWSRLRLVHPIRPKRLLLYLMIVMIVPLLLSCIIVQSTVAIVVRAQTPDYMEWHRLLVASQLPRLEQNRADWDRVRDFNNAVEMDVLPGFGRPSGIEISKDFRTQEEWEDFWTVHAARLDAQLEWYREFVDKPRAVHMPYVLAVLEAVALPLAKSSFGSISIGDDVEPYTAPVYLHDQYYMMVSQQQSPGQTMPMFRSLIDEMLSYAPGVAGALAFSMVFLIVFPLTFILLPITRRRAKVRTAHFARITAYSLFIPSAVFWAIVAVVLFSAVIPTWTIDAFVFLTLLLPLPMAWVWWYFAIKRHLHLPNAFWLVAIMSVVAILLIPSTMMVIYYVGLLLTDFGWIALA